MSTTFRDSTGLHKTETQRDLCLILSHKRTFPQYIEEEIDWLHCNWPHGTPCGPFCVFNKSFIQLDLISKAKYNLLFRISCLFILAGTCETDQDLCITITCTVYFSFLHICRLYLQMICTSTAKK